MSPDAAPAQHPLADLPCHDPWVIAVDGGYLLYVSFDGARWERSLPPGASSPAPNGTGVLAWWSPDLRAWSDPRVVFTVPGGCWADPASAPWAPEVHRWGGRYVLATTLHDPSTDLGPVRQRGTRVALSGETAPLAPVRRGTVLAVADDPRGPFELLDPARAHNPDGFTALDGTLVAGDDGEPWLVYAHEWVQVLDGTVEAVPLHADLSGASGPPVHLFRASEAPWYRELVPSAEALAPYVTDGPQVHRLPGGALAVLWASYRTSPDHPTGEYVQTQALSPSGSLAGPWEQGEVLVGGNAGHGMLLATHEGDLVLVLHRGMNTPRVRAEVHGVQAGPTGLRTTGRLV
ncbi:family 43 glycosylhydrolase [Quadrisphaera setariae]|uniref:family 43 glycosylhydrolase n=1 Tax=Quadrisphaera setariae TaxID=2593304 RepID=UPI001650A215|nr:family 43 glycosylhydrolase [Quadrisphaera setariae]